LRDAGGSTLGEDQFLLPAGADLHRVAGLEVAGEQALGERIQELVLDRAPERAGKGGVASTTGPP
jgi:hypothetical protein